jgi:hypothetical protein
MEIERKGSTFHRGREEGRQEGHRQMLKRAIIDMLEFSGGSLAPALRERVESCDSLALLERWYAAVKTRTDQPPDELLQ